MGRGPWTEDNYFVAAQGTYGDDGDEAGYPGSAGRGMPNGVSGQFRVSVFDKDADHLVYHLGKPKVSSSGVKENGGSDPDGGSTAAAAAAVEKDDNDDDEHSKITSVGKEIMYNQMYSDKDLLYYQNLYNKANTETHHGRAPNTDWIPEILGTSPLERCGGENESINWLVLCL